MGSSCRVPHSNRDGGRASGIGSGAHARGFWPKVMKRPDGCWDWLGYRDKDGAGKFCTNIAGKSRSFRAARFAWELEHGPIPAGHALPAIVCWNRRCVRPSHREAMPSAHVIPWLRAAGRGGEPPDNRGELSAAAKLTAEQVQEIRANYRRGAAHLLARINGISVHYVRLLGQGRNWKHLRGRPGDPMPIRLLRELAEQRSGA